jgi:hypothetical protein
LIVGILSPVSSEASVQWLHGWAPFE